MSTLRPLTLRHRIAAVLRPTAQQQTRHAQVLPIRFLQTHSAETRVAAKYSDKLSAKLREEGVGSLDELKQKYADKIQALRKEAAVPEVDALLGAGKKAQAPPRPQDPFTQPPPPAPRAADAGVAEAVTWAAGRETGEKAPPGVKTLASFVDPSKLAVHDDAREIEFIWRARFMQDPHSLCAVIPHAVYARMEQAARRYPMFILPLPREGQGVEMHFLQWTFPAAHSSTIIFTSLADYKLRGEFAVPHTTLTHHLELAAEKGVVLAQGNVVQDCGISADQAQLLVMALQKFYAAEESHDDGRRRKGMLEQFAKGDEGFRIEKLIEEVEMVN